ncbi:DUF4123 domain-containing protein [Vibrio algivorus]|nr:DUF4123 domain-containing protein [Vibrio algivorus]
MNNFWIVVDTVRIPDALKQLKMIAVLETVLPLYAGSDFDYLIEQSPLVINLGSDGTILEKWRTWSLFDSSSVIFTMDAEVDQYQLLDHLQALLTVKIEQTEFLFRFYTNVLWQQVAADLNHEDMATILGPASRLYWVDSSQNVQSFHKVHDKEKMQEKADETRPYHLTSSIFKQWV